MPSSALSCDVLIAGGGVGGIAAALAVARANRTAIVLEEYAWIGGQFTSQAVPPDEHGWIERFGCTATYRAFRDAVRRHYRDRLAPADLADPLLLDESRAALEAIGQVLNLGPVHDFQRI